MREQRSFACGKCGAAGVAGIYCEPCRAQQPVAAPPPRFAAGERVAFLYRGTLKQGTIEKVGRVNATVLIEVRGGKKQKLVRVAMEQLMSIVEVEKTTVDICDLLPPLSPEAQRMIEKGFDDEQLGR